MTHAITTADTLTPIGVLALEHDQPVEQFAAWLHRRGFTITVSNGLRCVPAAVAQRLYDEREAARAQAAADRRRRAGEVSPVQAHIAAVQRRQAELRAAGLDLDGIQMLLAVSGELDDGEAAADQAGQELMERSLAEALEPPRPAEKPAAPFDQLRNRR
ncbi:hypothetical protein [Mycobacterium paraintracellulare]|uniref:hypothetical protein n=1 Tax=Mycobacterium paraintracellulare TaxID=1138383 RepID=UPI0019295DDD|nr:hypothetical protein [Mycobacterium paraintracellulare]BCP15674.1 hypothetical protein MINTM021_25830 [Mycobacterium paraintracellulare]